MSRVAADDDHISPHGGKEFGRFYHFRNRAGTFAEDALGPVRHIGVVINDRVDMFLVFDGFGGHNDFLH